MDEPHVINKIGLPKLFLWMEAERLETYPEAFSRLQEDRIYKRAELAKEVFRVIYDEKNHQVVRGDNLRNCFGLEFLNEKIAVIHGINAVRQVQPGQYV